MKKFFAIRSNIFFCIKREIDFVNEKVRTLAGNRTKGSDYVGGGKGDSQVIKLISKC